MFEDKRFLVFGAGISGIGAVRLLSSITDKIVLYDGNENIDVDELMERVGVKTPYEIALGALSDEILKKADIAILSPGVPVDKPEVVAMKNAGMEIWGEVELAYRFTKGDLLAITGTNGKTTTTSLVGAIAKAKQEDSYITGNIGIPYTECAPKTGDKSITVLEISSFQLETTLEFHPHVSCILNITPDHLDRHRTFENYAKAKFDIVKNQTEDDFCILNYDDELLRDFAGKIKPKVMFFSSSVKLDKGIYLDGKDIYLNEGDGPRLICRTDEVKLLGRHNYENIMAAFAIAYKAGIPEDIIIKTIKEFTAVEHRIEFVIEKNGVRYYNDSKGTNPDAAIKAVEAMEWPTILIGGGYDKHSDYTDWIKSFGDKVKLLVLVGQTKHDIEKCAHENGFTNTVLCGTFEEAVKVCMEKAESGDAVLLSPACASWGMFKNYEERGRLFKELVTK